MEINNKMVNVLGESDHGKTMVRKWTGLFKNGHTSLEDDRVDTWQKYRVWYWNIIY